MNMKILILTVVLSVVQTSVPVPRQASNNPASASGKVQKKAKDKDTPPSPTPPPINQDQPCAAEGNTNQQGCNNAEHPIAITKLPPVAIIPAKRDWVDWGLWVFNALLVVVGGFQIWLLIRQLKIINRQADIAQNQENQMASAGQQTERIIAQMKDTTVRQLRAYVGVSKIFLNLAVNTHPIANVEIQNFGQTPAYEVRQTCRIDVNQYPPVTPLADITDEEGSVSLIPPGIKQTGIVALKKPLPSGTVIGTQTVTIYARGIITYKDAFGEKRRTTYRFIYGGPVTPTLVKSPTGTRLGAMIPDTSGNDAT